MTGTISKETALDLYRKMRLCRRFDETVIELVNKNEIYGVTHEYIGQEASAVGVCSALQTADYITSNHRGHGHIIAKGGDIRLMFSELMGKANGYNGGKGGSMHIADPGIGILGANGIVGAGTPIAVGAALALKHKNQNQVVVSFFGDGAINQGVVHEAMNMAAIWNLPVIFVCENNQYAVSTHISYSSKLENLSERAASYGFPVSSVNGMDVLEVFRASTDIIGRTRSGGGPYFLECKTYRFQGHFTAEPMLGITYRSESEISSYKEKCPLKTLGKKMLEENICTMDEIEEENRLIDSIIEEAVDFARNSSPPEPENALKDMYSTLYD